MKRAQESGTPFLSLFSPAEILEMAKEAGFKMSQHVSAQDLYRRYFANRSDGLNAGTAESFLVAAT
jgi:O-methyltransferase involved in polyketide biosynthesis